MSRRDLLSRIRKPEDLRKLAPEQLPRVAEELRAEILERVSKTGGHLASSLGAIELTLAIHYVFDTPRDRLVLDVGHQGYPHKMLTGRREAFHTLRQHGGISGFCKREESIYDTFNAGHAGTGVSAAVGMAVARDLAEQHLPDRVAESSAGEDVESYVLLKHLVVLLVTVGIGIWVSAWITRLGVTLPAYIGAMLVAAVFRNLDDVTGMLRLSQRTIDDIGNISLSLFLVMALMTLRLWELAGLVIPLLVILAAQVALIAAICVWVVPRLMGRDYDAATMSVGMIGFGLGATSNAVATMKQMTKAPGFNCTATSFLTSGCSSGRAKYMTAAGMA